MPYGVSDAVWKNLSAEDRAAVIASQTAAPPPPVVAPAPAPPPPAQRVVAPPPPPAPPRPAIPAASSQDVVLTPRSQPVTLAAPGQTILVPAPVGSNLPPVMIAFTPPVAPAEPSSPPQSPETVSDFDSAQALALANRPDLSNLPPWELDDPFAARSLEAANPPLKGGGALTAIAQACSEYGIDTRACIANALHEGAGGGIGDGGTAYGPFQIHLTDGRIREFFGKPKNDRTLNRWAWSENGLRYAVRGMVNGDPSAKGLIGHAAVYAIVYGFERPGDKRGAYTTRAAEYDRLVGLGSGWAAYAAAKLAGPKGGGGKDTHPITTPKGGAAGPAAREAAPAGVQKAWEGLIDVYAKSVPRTKTQVDSLAKALPRIFK